MLSSGTPKEFQALWRQPQRHDVPIPTHLMPWLANDPQKLGLQRREGSHLLLPLPRDAVDVHQPAEAMAQDTHRRPHSF